MQLIDPNQWEIHCLTAEPNGELPHPAGAGWMLMGVVSPGGHARVCGVWVRERQPAEQAKRLSEQLANMVSANPS